MALISTHYLSLVTRVSDDGASFMIQKNDVDAYEGIDATITIVIPSKTYVDLRMFPQGGASQNVYFLLFYRFQVIFRSNMAHFYA